MTGCSDRGWTEAAIGPQEGDSTTEAVALCPPRPWKLLTAAEVQLLPCARVHCCTRVCHSYRDCTSLHFTQSPCCPSRPAPVGLLENSCVFLTQLSRQQPAGQTSNSSPGLCWSLDHPLPEPQKRVRAQATDGTTSTEL